MGMWVWAGVATTAASMEPVVARGDVRAAIFDGLAEGDIATIGREETTQVPFADGAGSDDEDVGFDGIVGIHAVRIIRVSAVGAFVGACALY